MDLFVILSSSNGRLQRKSSANVIRPGQWQSCLGDSTKSIFDWVKLYGDKTDHADHRDKDEIG